MQVENTTQYGRNTNTYATEQQKGIEQYLLQGDDKASMQVISEEYKKSGVEKSAASGAVRNENVTYQKPGAKEEKQTVADALTAQEEADASERYNEMAVISNTTSTDDLKKLEEEGFSIHDTDSATIVTVLDKIKVSMAKTGAEVLGLEDTLSAEQLQKIAGNEELAMQIANELQKQDLPVTIENLEEALSAMEELSKIEGLGEKGMEYLLVNQLPPSIENMYKAQFSYQEGNQKQQQGYSISEEDFTSVRKQVEEIIQSAGLMVDEKTIADSRWLLSEGIPLNAHNLKYLEDLRSFAGQQKTSQDYTAAIVESIGEGNRGVDTMIIDGYSLLDRATEAYTVVQKATDADVEQVISSEKELTIASIREAINRRTGETGANENQERDSDTKTEGKETLIHAKNELALLTAKRQLEELRLAMSTKANYALLKKGISIDTKPLVELVEDLRQQEDSYYRSLLEKNGIDASRDNISVFKETTEVVTDLKGYPAYALSLFSATESLHTLHETGKALAESFASAKERYETMMTSPRTDLGDSLQKAFRNVDDILNDLKLEPTEASRRAVRILSYNRIEISEDHIRQMMAQDEEVQRTFSNLTPRVTLEMIRKNINPLDMSISDLNQVAEEIQSELGDEETDRYSKYLWKLEQRNEISAKERETYIGIYRLIAQVEKTDGAAIGALVQQGAEITMRNLLSAVRTGKKASMEYKVDDSFSGVDAVEKGTRIDAQIEASFIHNILSDIAKMATPSVFEGLTEDAVAQMTPEQLKEYMTEQSIEVQEEEALQDEAYARQQLDDFAEVLAKSEDVYSFLERAELPNTMYNVLAASRMLRNPNKMFEDLWSTLESGNSKLQTAEELKEMIFEKFGEAIKSPEDMADAQETLADVAENVMDTMIIEDKTLNADGIRELRLMSRQFAICAKQTSQESYVIPMQTNDSVTGVTLKIVRGTEKKGLVEIMFQGAYAGKVVASFEAKENAISGMIATDDVQTRQLVADHLGMLVEKLNEDGEEAVDMRVAVISDLSLERYHTIGQSAADAKEAKEKNPEYSVQTKRLYHIAESFIATMQEIL